ncbi:hypothetical protein VCSRO66_2243 [Vibrio cholerae]|nr:hypothetical protein VCSRO66_2243 [Vibrio cholerae]GHY22754.1 hypothetical protein VCSRO69_3302 [Vibrio cholerae]GIB10470.1 hypothetical protein VCSRO90_1027 [Vibrio cholerae]
MVNLLVHLPIVFQPTIGMKILRIFMSPAKNSTLFVRLVFTIKLNTVTNLQVRNFLC